MEGGSGDAILDTNDRGGDVVWSRLSAHPGHEAGCQCEHKYKHKKYTKQTHKKQIYMKTQITPGFYVDFRDGVMKSSLKQSLTLKMTPPHLLENFPYMQFLK